MVRPDRTDLKYYRRLRRMLLKTAAIFDLDGTILDISSERTFFWYLFFRGEISLKNLAVLSGHFVNKVYKANYTEAIKANKMYLHNKPYMKIYELASKCFSEKMKQHISEDVVTEIERHRQSGRLLMLLSGTLEFLLAHFMEHLRMDLMVGTSMEIRNDAFTGRMDGIHPFGESKAVIARQIAQEHKIDLKESYGYANSFSDVPFLSAFGHAVAVNPDRALLRYAKQHNWKVMS